MKFSLILLQLLFLFNVGFSQHSMHKAPVSPSVLSGPSVLSSSPEIFAVTYDVLSDKFVSVEGPDFLSLNDLISYSANFYCGDRGPGNVLYVANNDDKSLYSVDFEAGTVSFETNISGLRAGHTFTSMSYHSPSGTMYFGSSNGSESWLYTLDVASGVLTPVGQVTNCDILIDFAVNTDGELYGVDIDPDNLVNINTSNGSGTVIGSVGFNANFAQSMDFDDKTGVLYWAAYSFDGSFRTIDTSTGMSTQIQPAASEFTVLSMGASATVPVNIFAVISIFILAGGVVVIRFLRK
ncbi:MAG: hypothetical protein K9G70_06010 [Prolixibacteraceae bacterium]|nr:hypothetical protein [Prolixibacteraceae bacterium]